MAHYFQRYSQRENWVTNSTLLLLSRLYHFKRRYFEEAINSILDGSGAGISTAVKFDQQVGGASNGNVIDGLIRQESFALAIETKLYDNQDEAQLTRHLESLRADADVKVLLALSVHHTDESLLQVVRDKITNGPKEYNDIKVVSTTYEQLIEAIDAQLTPRDSEIQDVLGDYRRLCEEQQLISMANRTLLAVAVKDSLAMNLEQELYYCPSNRNYNQTFEFIGFYHYKHLRAAGKIELAVAVDLVEGKLSYPEGKPEEITDAQEARILRTIQGTTVYNLRTGIRFYLLTDFTGRIEIPVDRPIMSKKYFTFDRPIDLTSGDAIALLRQGVAQSFNA